MLASKESQMRLHCLATPQITLDTAGGQLPPDGQPQQQQAVEAPGQQQVGGRLAQSAAGPGRPVVPAIQSLPPAAVTQVRGQGFSMHAMW